MLTLLEALDELNSKSESELTLDYLEELAKGVFVKTNRNLWECHKQFMGIAKPKREADIDEVVPMGI